MIRIAAPGARHLLEDREQILHHADLPVGEEDQHVLQHRLHLLGVGDEVGREVAAVELQALDHLELGLGRLGLLDGDHALVADLLHRVGDHVADAWSLWAEMVAICAFSSRLFTGRDSSFSASTAALGAAVETPLEIHRAGARHHVPHAVGEDGVGQDRRGAGAVAHRVAGALRGLADHLDPQVLHVIPELHLLGDRHAVVADDRRPEALLEEHALGLRPERDADRVGQGGDAFQDPLARFGPEEYLLARHVVSPRAKGWSAPPGPRSRVHGEFLRFVNREVTRPRLGEARVVGGPQPDRGAMIPGRQHDVALLDERLVHHGGDVPDRPDGRDRAERAARECGQHLLHAGQADLAATDQSLDPVEVGHAAGRQGRQREPDRILDHDGLDPRPAGDVGAGGLLLRREGLRMLDHLVPDTPRPQELFQSCEHDIPMRLQATYPRPGDRKQRNLGSGGRAGRRSIAASGGAAAPRRPPVSRRGARP